MDKVYDIIVLGAGPAGLTAASYAGRSRIDPLLIEGEKDGGQIVITNEIENYPGCLEEESGPSLIARMTKQVEKSTEYYSTTQKKKGKLASKAGMVQQYNEKSEKKNRK